MSGKSARLRRILSLDDLETAARRFLPRPIFGYVSGAAETGASLRGDREAFDEWSFVPRVLNDVSKRTTETTLFGKRYTVPFGIAPMGISALVAYRGDLVLAEAARDANMPMIVSGSSLTRMEEIAATYPGAWFQAYVPGEPARIDALLERVAAAGFGTLVVTVDVSVSANRETNIRTGFSTPLRPSLRLAYDGLIRPRWTVGTFLRTLTHGIPHFENSQATRGAPIIAKNVMRDFGARDHLNWTHLAQIRRRWPGTLVVKGILDARDATLAADHGADGIIVSNHGGRQLDGAIAPLRALESIAQHSGGVKVMLDGGIRRGSDVLKALALGAEFVFVGRPFLYAAALGGTCGVNHAIDILKQEVRRNLGLVGVSSPGEITHDALARSAC
ncbi:L-lactate dehydrogenase (cytochrome) [Rhizobium subbaraonis]|uniref:L-lactate dehydrogenase (Cytochrome) n=1 Tax=Rhizobium subbaraonis TaxID=908946 RepID=A0A285UXA5_9HYPH|nr:alpha-hydroxy acid oxidase [Rhizobium subbaraonis]SOC46317.1 L-lactate dehydrogenase (cytochrome) [Rhizobium subbaraonis]